MMKELEHETVNEEEVEDDNEDTDSSEEDESGDEDEDDAEAIARRLGDQLWADIQRARENPPPPPQKSPKEEAAILTIKTVLSYAISDPLVHQTLSTTTVPGFPATSVLDMLNQISQKGTVSQDIAAALSPVIVKLAKSEALFSPLPVVPLSPQNYKRKRESFLIHDISPPQKRFALDTSLQTRLIDAIDVISKTLGTQPTTQALDSVLISSIQQQLHQVFLFAMTASSAAGQSTEALQEVSSLIQVLGILSGIQIAIPETRNPEDENESPTTALSHADIGTAVYPCLAENCRKVFTRLFSLRQHQRAHAAHRPYKCERCPASFARNHDLKRHIKGHGGRAFRCSVCQKVFSRRDAIKRHKDGGTRMGKKVSSAFTSAISSNPCENAEVEEVEVEEDDRAAEGRRARLWGGIMGLNIEDGLEEGELRQEEFAKTQAAVASLHSLLHGHVSAALKPGTTTTTTSLPTPTPTPREPMTIASAMENVTIDPAISSTSPDTSPSDPSTLTAAQIVTPAPDVPLSATVEKAGASSSLSGYGLSEHQARLLEMAIANATAAAQAQAEAEALLEERDEEGDDDDDDGEGGEDGEDNMENEGGEVIEEDDADGDAEEDNMEVAGERGTSVAA